MLFDSINVKRSPIELFYSDLEYECRKAEMKFDAFLEDLFSFR